MKSGITHPGGWLKRMFVETYGTNEAIKKVREKEKVTEIYGVRRVWYTDGRSI